MTDRTETVQALLALPGHERLEALESVVVTEFRAALLMTEDEGLPLDKAFFELGLTSLRITEVKRRLEDRLGCDISANALFNRPTVRELVAYLSTDVLTDLFPQPTARAAAPSDSGGDVSDGDRALVDDLLKDLYSA
ncbi:acyl carrier protein [Actinokineospora sp. NBRC 105648]|uniref:acyl carrier protein n=1 Tax=Actinokineospora sp. NBRC 105648 TaxID=3032206 RepID=UPI0024A42610|nr:acyl carrier protein [Actinokineospora sp. NBRC 105648]GLZ42501.1 hypothetical protein Acsp05_61250 [Actinokineospora sp. NBRC 105648]